MDDRGESLNRRFADLVPMSEAPDRLVRERPMSNFDIDVTRDGGWPPLLMEAIGFAALYKRKVEGQPQDLVLARQDIDLLGLLQEKTKGNLTGDEERLLDQALFDLRMRFIEVSKGT